MRIPSLFRSQEQDLDSMMTPMIDVVFLLLVFFVWTTSVRLTEYILPGQISAQLGNRQEELTEIPPERDFDDVVIRLEWDGNRVRRTINEVPFGTIEQLLQRLEQIAGIKSDAPVVVHPEALVPIGFVIEAYDLARLAGFQQVSLAVEQDEL